MKKIRRLELTVVLNDYVLGCCLSCVKPPHHFHLSLVWLFKTGVMQNDNRALCRDRIGVHTCPDPLPLENACFWFIALECFILTVVYSHCVYVSFRYYQSCLYSNVVGFLFLFSPFALSLNLQLAAAGRFPPPPPPCFSFIWHLCQGPHIEEVEQGCCAILVDMLTYIIQVTTSALSSSGRTEVSKTAQKPLLMNHRNPPPWPFQFPAATLIS